MKYLSQFNDFSESSERIERKYFLGLGLSHLAHSALLKANFRPEFSSRKISSLYYDTENFSALRDNIDGNPNRNKFRIRYYNDDISSAYIEIKQKRSAVGYKHTYPINNKFKSLEKLREFGSSWLRQNVIDNLIPVALVTYNRLYFRNNNFRATLDSNVVGYRISGKSYFTSSLLNYGVVEFKFPIESDKDFRKLHPFFVKFALRNTKSSKYANALMN